MPKNYNKMVMDLVRTERKRQLELWGDEENRLNNSVFEGLAVLGEEVGEASRAALEGNDFVTELVQTAAVAIAMAEAALAGRYDD